MRQFICLNCGTINAINTNLECATCKKCIDRRIYRTIVKSAKDAVYYGYEYRVRYERKLKETGTINGRYSLIAPSNYYEFLAAAIIAGAAGNFVYDIIKAVAKKIADSLSKKLKLSYSESELIKIIKSEKRLKKFIKYILDYTDGMTGAKKQVKDAIQEEIVADVYGKLHKQLRKAVKSRDKKQMKRFLEKVRKEVEAKRKTRLPQDIEEILRQIKEKQE